MLEGEIIPSLPGWIKTADINEIVFIQLIEYIASNPILFSLFKIFKFKLIEPLAGVGHYEHPHNEHDDRNN